jgi:hypothetical protein
MSKNKYQVNVPEGEVGSWKVSRYTISADDVQRQALRMMASGSRRHVPAGTYTKLTYHGQIIMSDTPDEIRDHFEVIRVARGTGLINGLGLGMVIQAVLRKEEVEHVTVIEKSPEVIQLVGPHYEKMFGKRLTIIEADALTWKPPKGARYDFVWHDIWSAMSAGNLPQMHKLHRRYGRFTYWQRS